LMAAQSSLLRSPEKTREPFTGVAGFVVSDGQ